jgi:hypothetical protein
MGEQGLQPCARNLKFQAEMAQPDNCATQELTGVIFLEHSFKIRRSIGDGLIQSPSIRCVKMLKFGQPQAWHGKMLYPDFRAGAGAILASAAQAAR